MRTIHLSLVALIFQHYQAASYRHAAANYTSKMENKLLQLGMTFWDLILPIQCTNDLVEFLNPKNPCSLLLFMHDIKASPLSMVSTYHQPPTSSNFVGNNWFFFTISSHTGPLSFILSAKVALFPPSSNPYFSIPNCSARTFHKCFHLK